jgi:hypothetical protein
MNSGFSFGTYEFFFGVLNSLLQLQFKEITKSRRKQLLRIRLQHLYNQSALWPMQQASLPLSVQ